jgi:3-hydroxyacyl-[acyl-carrier-protein] dehydratase
MSITITETELTDLKELLRRCSAPTVDAAVRFRETGDPKTVPTIIYGLIERYQPSTSTVKLSEANDDTRLVEDLGLDSLSLLELVLAVEEVLKLKIENEELREIRTIGNLNSFLQNKLIAPAAAASPLPQ